tara:strand:+ start:1366 stop:2436 length:1071 start_codon:yes stop_codon:yes gene_type:complete
MKILRICLIVLFTLVSFKSNAQITDKEKSNFYFQEAKKRFEEEKYADAIKLIDNIQNSLKITNATVLDLKIRTYVKLDSFRLADEAISTYLQYYLGTVNESLSNETLSFLGQIKIGVDSIKTVEKQKAKYEQISQIIAEFKSEKCHRCKGKGEYSLTKLHYGWNPWWVKEKKTVCELCNGEGKLLNYPKNDSICDITEKKFVEIYEEDIRKHIENKKKLTKNNGLIKLYKKLIIQPLSYLAFIKKKNPCLMTNEDFEKYDSCDLKNKRQFRKIKDSFESSSCERCLGEGKYSLTELLYGDKKPWWTKEKIIICEICQGKGLIYNYSKNDSILNMTEKEFVKLHMDEINEHLNKKNK